MYQIYITTVDELSAGVGGGGLDGCEWMYYMPVYICMYMYLYIYM